VLGYLAGAGVKHRVVLLSEQLLVAEVDFYPPEVASRLAMTHRIIEVLGICKADEASIIQMVQGLKLDLSREEKFCVRVKRIKSQAAASTARLEKLLGGIIHRRGYEVDLRNPQALFRLILTGDFAVFGRVLAAIERGKFEGRKPQLKPFFHPGVLMPHIARALVNISGIRSEELLLDPFCGAGGILVEAGFTGATVIGSDFQSRMVKGAKLNLDFYGAKYFLMAGDACDLPLKSKCIDAIVTDPPYGRSARVGARDIEDLYRRSLLEMHRVLKRGKIAIVVSQRSIESLAEGAGFEILEVIRQRVHRSLTRHVWILRKRG